MNSKNYICTYCGKQCRSGQSLGGHMVRCSLNPKAAQSTLKMSKTNTHIRNRIKLECKKCGKAYTLNLTENQFNNNRYTFFCSRSCSNSHSVSQKTRIKIGNTLRKFVPVNHTLHCILCGKQFNWIQKGKNQKVKIYCSQHCSQRIAQKHIDHSKKLLQAYKHGKKVGGGYTKWIQYKDIKVQGTFQYRVCKILDYWMETGNIKRWEYAPDRIEYTWQNGEVHYYIPDFKVFNFDGTEYYIQVKGYTKQLDERKWSQTKQRGYNLIVWFESNIIENESLIRD